MQLEQWGSLYSSFSCRYIESSLHFPKADIKIIQILLAYFFMINYAFMAGVSWFNLRVDAGRSVGDARLAAFFSCLVFVEVNMKI